MAAIVVAVAAAATAAVVVAAFLADTGGEPRTVRGLEIDGRSAGNLDDEELSAVLAEIEAEVEQTEVAIDMPDGRRVVAAGDVGISLDSNVVRRRAFEAGAGDGLWQRFSTWVTSFVDTRSVPISLSFDREAAAAVVADFDGLIVSEPTEPSLVLSEDNDLVVEGGRDGLQVDRAAVVDRLGHQVDAGGPFSVDAPVVALAPDLDDAPFRRLADHLNQVTEGGVVVRIDDERRTLAEAALRARLDIVSADGEPEAAFDVASLRRLIEQVFANLQKGGTDPVFDIVDGAPVVVEEGTLPVVCCRDGTAEEVADAILEGASEPIEVEPRPTRDERLVEWATGSPVVELVAEFTTEHSCCEGRVGNIQRFADLVRGVYLVPGESLSLNGHVGERTAERGFVPAGTIIRGRLVPTVGGGVSQFATTIFNAAFFAGFDFETYQSHSIYFSRYPYGREATISWPAPDLEFTNTTDYPALIWTSYTDTSITVSVYSTPSVEVEQTGQEVSSVRACTRVDTFRRRTYEDGTTVDDSVFAVYRPGEGLDCNGDPTPQA